MTDALSIDAALALVHAAGGALSKYKKDLLVKREEEFLAAGGCANCNGQGNVCTWGTMDSLTGGYDEFGTCPKCNGNTVAWAGSNRHRLSQHPKKGNLPPLAVMDDEVQTLATLEKNVLKAQKAHELAKAAAQIVKGSRVKVVRGRKVPQGTEGVVFWMGDGSTGGPLWAQRSTTRLGIKTDDGVTHWVNDASYCVNVNPRTVEQIDNDYQSQRASSAVRAYVNSGSQIDSEAVSGKVAWAGYTKRGDGPWRALVKAQGQDHWLSADQIRAVGGTPVEKLSA